MSPVEVVKVALLQTGVSWILWFLAALSILGFAVGFERLWTLWRAKADLRKLAEQLDMNLAAGGVPQALAQMQAPAVAAAIARAGLRLAHLGPTAADRAMQSAVALERARLERGLTFLATLGNNAPFIGLFGTVVGVIAAFEHLGHAGHSGAAASAEVMASIAEALVTTAAGIGVALPAVAMHNAIQRQITSLLQGADALSNLVLAYLTAEKQP